MKLPNFLAIATPRQKINFFLSAFCLSFLLGAAIGLALLFATKEAVAEMEDDLPRCLADRSAGIIVCVSGDQYIVRKISEPVPGRQRV